MRHGDESREDGFICCCKLYNAWALTSNNNRSLLLSQWPHFHEEVQKVRASNGHMVLWPSITFLPHWGHMELWKKLHKSKQVCAPATSMINWKWLLRCRWTPLSSSKVMITDDHHYKGVNMKMPLSPKCIPSIEFFQKQLNPSHASELYHVGKLF